MFIKLLLISINVHSEKKNYHQIFLRMAKISCHEDIVRNEIARLIDRAERMNRFHRITDDVDSAAARRSIWCLTVWHTSH